MTDIVERLRGHKILTYQLNDEAADAIGILRVQRDFLMEQLRQERSDWALKNAELHLELKTYRKVSAV